MLAPEDRWVWDFWHARDGDTHHLFYLQASKSLGDPGLRHRHATIGHATSTDLTTWVEHGMVLQADPPGDRDATAAWSGSVIRDDSGLWWMFYTETEFFADTNEQRITAATSLDLHSWEKRPSVAVHAEHPWYERRGESAWPEACWRDPWISRDRSGLWHMLITARARAASADADHHATDFMDRGAIGHATSTNLHDWSLRPPLAVGSGFAQLEVLQCVEVDSQDFVIFSSQRKTMTRQRVEQGGDDGVWSAPIVDGTIQLSESVNLTGRGWYAGRLVEHLGRPHLLAFRDFDSPGAIGGNISDPMPIALARGRLTVTLPAPSSSH